MDKEEEERIEELQVANRKQRALEEKVEEGRKKVWEHRNVVYTLQNKLFEDFPHLWEAERARRVAFIKEIQEKFKDLKVSTDDLI